MVFAPSPARHPRAGNVPHLLMQSGEAVIVLHRK
jgi:hypothetical protein